MSSKNINTPELGFSPKGLLIGGKFSDVCSGYRLIRLEKFGWRKKAAMVSLLEAP